jgi:hypothetical protein
VSVLHSVYLLYWYKSTNTDAEGAAGTALYDSMMLAGFNVGTHFTCFTGTNVLALLAQRCMMLANFKVGAMFTCFTVYIWVQKYKY